MGIRTVQQPQLFQTNQGHILHTIDGLMVLRWLNDHNLVEHITVKIYNLTAWMWFWCTHKNQN